MKKILITGLNSYIGDSFANWLAQWPNDYEVTKWDFKDQSWKNKSFSEFDSILNVAGIAHNSNDYKLEDLYYRVNTDLAIAIAEKAKDDGVKQYIHLSSIIVYGSRVEEINPATPFDPDNFYGDSKVQAEIGLEKLENDKFNIAIIRPPMIFGKGSKGNYPLLSKFARKTPVFPDIQNKRSMLHIDNLSELIRLIIDQKSQGLYFPQMEDYVSTSLMVKEIASVHNKNIILTSTFNPALRILKNQETIKKVFGNLYYVKDMSRHFEGNYQINNLKESIRQTEKG